MKTLAHTFNRLATSPFLWGAAAYATFLFLLKNVQGPGLDFVRRYTTEHPIEYIETLLFFLALATLLFKAWEIAAELGRLAQLNWLPDIEGLNPQDALAVLRQQPRTVQEQTLVRMLQAGLLFLSRRESSQGLEEHLTATLDQEIETRRAGYGFVRLVVWAIPILGFLGTVVGITLSLGNLAPQQLEETLPTVMAGLMVAFDTTALALALSMVLMLIQYAVDRSEQKLLKVVADRAELLLDAYLNSGPLARPVRQRSESDEILQACERLVQTQIELWQKSLKHRDAQWQATWENLQESLQKAISEAISTAGQQYLESLHMAEEVHRQKLLTWQRSLLETSREQLQPVAETLARAVQELHQVQTGLQQQVAEWTNLNRHLAELTQTQQILQENLTAVATARHFEEVLVTLAAAANLLSAHLQRLPMERAARPEGPSAKAKAA